MNHGKLIRRIKLGEKIAERHRLRRWVQGTFDLEVLKKYYLNVPNRLYYLGPEGLSVSDYEGPGGMSIPNNVEFER